MIYRIMCLLVMLQIGDTAQKSVFTPTSELLRVSEMAARDEGFKIDNNGLFFFDVATTSEGKQLVRGYTSMGFYGNGQPIHIYSVNEMTGQVVDIGNCEVFSFPDLRAFARKVQKQSGTRARTDEELAREVGCDVLEVIDKPFPIDGKKASGRK
jgi:hypothetical protein